MKREAYSREEAASLIRIARRHEPRFAPFLELLFATGLRRGEALGLQWADVEFAHHRITIRRSMTTEGLSTPKSGKSRRVVITRSLERMLRGLHVDWKEERMAAGRPDTPDWIFSRRAGHPPHPRTIVSDWHRVRRLASKESVRALPLHSTRHSWATWAIQAAKNPRWVSDQIGHADVSTTLNHYAHAMPEDDTDLSFLDLDVSERQSAVT